jgi:hypothetical protein
MNRQFRRARLWNLEVENQRRADQRRELRDNYWFEERLLSFELLLRVAIMFEALPEAPPACVKEHDPGCCDECAQWQARTHRIVEGYLVPNSTSCWAHDAKLLIDTFGWPIQEATRQILDRACEMHPHPRRAPFPDGYLDSPRFQSFGRFRVPLGLPWTTPETQGGSSDVPTARGPSE